jgi:hypothetical protein
MYSSPSNINGSATARRVEAAVHETSRIPSRRRLAPARAVCRGHVVSAQETPHKPSALTRTRRTRKRSAAGESGSESEQALKLLASSGATLEQPEQQTLQIDFEVIGQTGCHRPNGDQKIGICGHSGGAPSSRYSGFFQGA